MKQYHINYSYKGRWFDFRFCAKTHKIAAKILRCSIYHLTVYGGFSKIDVPYNEIFVKPYCHRATKEIGHRDEILFEDAKKIIDKISKKFNNQFL